MKYTILILALLVSCKKDERACYTCTQKVQHYNPNYLDTLTTRYCNKTPEEIQQIQDVALKGTVGSKYYLGKICKKD